MRLRAQGQIAGERPQEAREERDAEEDKQHARDFRSRVQPSSVLAQQPACPAVGQARRQERQHQAGGVGGQQERALGDGAAGAGQHEDAGQHGADARRPADRERR